MDAKGAKVRSKNTDYRADIDGLRALAVLSVVVFHAFPSALTGGFVGVDIFFVISGYLISRIIFRSLLNGSFSFSQFYIHRVKRIFPALFLVLLASFVIGWFVLLPHEFAQLGKHIAAGAGFMQNFVLLMEDGYFDTASDLKPLLHLWSLAVEEQFYIIFPVFIWLLWRFRWNIFLGVLSMALLSFLLNILTLEYDATRAFFSPQYRIWEILAGCLISYLQVFKAQEIEHLIAAIERRAPAVVHRQALSSAISLIGIFLILAALLFVNKNEPFPGWLALVPVVGAVLLISAGPEAWTNRVILAKPLPVYIGLISYPLYLWHWPLLSFIHIVDGTQPNVSVRIGAVLLAVLLSFATYRYVEKPIRYGAPIRRSVFTLCGLVSVAAAIGLSTQLLEGFPSRHDHLQELHAQFRWDGLVANEACAMAYPDLTGEHCILSRLAEPTIALLGDSHSNALYPGLTDAVEVMGDVVVNFARGACTPFFDVATILRGKTDYCVDYTNRALAKVLSMPSVHTILLSSRGPLYTTGKGYNEGYDLFLRSPDVPEGSSSSEVFESGMRKTLSRLVMSGKKIIFVLDVPELGFDPRTCFPARPWSRQKSPCAISRAEYEARSADYRDTVKKVLADYPEVMLIDASSLFCTDELCWAEKDGKAVYRDDDHLSIYGSKLLGKKILTHIHPITVSARPAPS